MVEDMGAEQKLRAALEPFAAFARAAETIRRFSGQTIPNDRVIQSVTGEGGFVGVLTYGHVLDALDAFEGSPRGWGGSYRKLRSEGGKLAIGEEG